MSPINPNTWAHPESPRTTVLQLDRPGDASVFGPTVRAAAAEIIAKYPAGQERSALLPLLHLVQSEQDCVTADGIAFCAETLGLTKAQVSAVATFYTMYKREPVGEYLVSVCTNTLCGMLGGDDIWHRLQDKLGVGMNETTPDRKMTLEHAECLAACDYAPVVTVNYEFFDNQTVESAEQLVDQLAAGQRPQPSRGAPLCSFREIERQIAGLVDERDASVTANGSGVPTERGVRLAIDRGESAPSYAAGDERAGAGNAERAAKATVGGPTSEHDAPLKTAESDPNNAAKPGSEKGK